MKRTWLIRVLLFIAYCVPYAFLSVSGDAHCGTMMFYGVMVAAFFVLSLLSIKTYNTKIVYIGTILSGVSSSLLVSLSGMEALGWYFKPFTAHSLIAAITLVALLIQAIIVHAFVTKDSRSKA